MAYHLDDNIAAIASPPGGAARGIIRLSGPTIVGCWQGIFEPRGDGPPAHAPQARAWPGGLRCPGWACAMPCELYFWPTKRSYTRAPLAEFHTLGAPPLLEAVLGALCQRGARLAEPGEFTLRAFLSGRIDLTQAEGVLGTIEAQTPQELRAALDQLAGGLSRPLTALRDELLDLLAQVEAGLDFADEDLELLSRAEIVQHIGRALEAIEPLQAQLKGRTTAPALPRVVLTGSPNAGKSSLFNALLRMPAHRPGTSPPAAVPIPLALVSPQAGTTRDYLTAELDLGGLRCELVDTAGWEDAAAPGLAAAAQRLAQTQQRRADVRLVCLDAAQPPRAGERQRLGQVDPRSIVVLTKCDLVADDRAAGRAIEQLGAEVRLVVRTSSHTGQGLMELCEQIRACVESQGPASSAVAGTAARCESHVHRARRCLARALELAASAAGDELVAAEIRQALDDLGQIVGAVYTDDLLDRIFSRFCIGK
jgi:tRNA modification GTPase